MKKKISLLAFLTCLTINAFAQNYEVDGIYYHCNYEIAVVTKGPQSNYYSGDIIIPEFIIYNDFTSRVESIDDEAFKNAKNLTSVVIPESVTSIGERAFSCCDNLTSVVIPNSVSEIGDGAFEYCKNLTSIVIPESTTQIGSSVFTGCTNLTNLVFNAQNLNSCSALRSLPIQTLVIGEKVTVIPNSAFNSNQKLNSITIPNSVKRIGSRAFVDCTNLTDVIIGDSVRIIGHNAFSGCTNLKNVTLGTNVSFINYRAFSGDKNIRTIISKNITPPVCNNYSGYSNAPVFESVKVEYLSLIVPQESISLYETADTWRDFWNILGKDYSNIEEPIADDVNISAEDGNIVINGVENEKVEVYSVNGQCVYSGRATNIPVTAKGLYIVKVNDKPFKVMM